MINVKINIQPAIRELNRVRGRFRNFRPLFDIIRKRYLITSIRQIFRSNGRGTWAPTQRPNPILRDTRALIRSYTQPGARGNINRTTNRRLTWGSSIEYAQYHEFGRGRRRRTVLELLTRPGEDRKVQALADRWVARSTRVR